MKKIDFTKVVVENVDGSFDTVDLSKILGNAIWGHANSLEISELGRRIWKDGEVEIGKEEVALLNTMIPHAIQIYIIKKALLDLLND